MCVNFEVVVEIVSKTERFFNDYNAIYNRLENNNND